MKVTNCDSTNTVNQTNLRLSIRKYGRNSSEVVKITAYPLTPVTRDSELYNFPLTKQTNKTYTGLPSPCRQQRMLLAEFIDGRHMKVASLTVQRNGRLYQPENTAETLIC
jgi:hypothetical protein